MKKKNAKLKGGDANNINSIISHVITISCAEIISGSNSHNLRAAKVKDFTLSI